MTTTHTPINFDPADYNVLDYFDNVRPVCFDPFDPTTREEWQATVRAWEADLEAAYGADWRNKIHRCVHCGNTNVRWITAVKHLPTGEVLTFGADCTKRLDFPNRVAFKLAQVQAKAEAVKVRFAIWQKRQQYLAAHPEIAEALAAITSPEHSRNTFAQDVLSKLNTYGFLTENQRAAVVASLQRDRETAARRAVEATEPKGDAPNGRCEVTGTILSLKERETDFGLVTKALVKLANGAKVWFTANWDVARGDTITVRATFEVSRDDKSFAFGKRPHLVARVPAPQVAA